MGVLSTVEHAVIYPSSDGKAEIFQDGSNHHGNPSEVINGGLPIPSKKETLMGTYGRGVTCIWDGPKIHESQVGFVVCEPEFSSPFQESIWVNHNHSLT